MKNECFFLLGILAFQSSAHAETDVGLIGGRNSTTGAAYAALVSSDGVVTNLSSLPSINGQIYSVAINSAGVGLIGGWYSDGAYAALVSSDGAVTNLSSLPSEGEIDSVAINSAGVGLIGGQNFENGAAYAVLVSPNGAVTNLSSLPSAGGIYSVAINSAGVGLIGGRNSDVAYAALVSSDGAVTNLSLLSSDGRINSVAINSAGVGLIGGHYSNAAYAALVSPDGAITNLSLLPSDGRINSVAINSVGIGLIGGHYSNAAYAALVSPDGAITNLSSLPSEGELYSVAINSASVGLIGGYDSDAAYAALVSANGAVTNLSPLPAEGEIYSVAINNAGIGLIGGQDTAAGSTYAALVSANGVVTNISSLPSQGVIYSVAIGDSNDANNAVVPQSIGSYASAIYSQLAASEALELRLVSAFQWAHDSSPKEVAAQKLPPCTKSPKYTFWTEPFGNYIHLKKHGSIPKYTNEIGGVLAAFDYHTTDLLLGGGLGYAFNYAHYSESQGHGKIHEELAAFYSSFKTGCVWIDAVIWGGLYQFHNERHMLSFITSTAHTHGWILSPHLEACVPYDINYCIIEPFARFDWTNAWQSHYTEHGKSGLNIVMDSQYASLLQSEAGLRFFETTQWCWGKCQFEEKLSYVNQAPFHFENKNTFFVASASTFPIATGNNKVQNLVSAQFVCSFLPDNCSYPFVIIDLEGQFGSSLQSYFASLQIGKDF